MTITFCYRLNVCISPNSNVETLTPKVMVSTGANFGSWLGHDSRSLLNGISTITKEAPEGSLDASVIGGHGKKMADCEPGRGPSRNTRSWTSHFPELWEINICYLLATRSMVFCWNSLNRLRHFQHGEKEHLFTGEKNN